MYFQQKHAQKFMDKYKHRARLLISCPDQPGIVAAVTTFLYEQGANIVESSQYSTDPEGGTFFYELSLMLRIYRNEKRRWRESSQRLHNVFQ
ncbi:formyltetrahydrofolate deformylase [Anoxybacillus sp. BCO1]|nr:formyltetrahydrofolate deformylase [Anoxybacillus sp. BCO1]